MEFKDSKTAKNLYTAFTGEVQAHAKYKYYSDKAKKEGYEQIAEIFKYTADNELEHAKLWFKALGKLNDTNSNLKDAISGEHFEWSEMYKEFAKDAEAEGYDNIAKLFHGVASIEANHEKRYQALLDNITNDEVFKKNEKVIWECRNCGQIHEGNEAPEICPVCSHKQSYYQIFAENY